MASTVDYMTATNYGGYGALGGLGGLGGLGVRNLGYPALGMNPLGVSGLMAPPSPSAYLARSYLGRKL